MEMPEAEVSDRLYALRSGVPLRAVTGRLNDEQAARVAETGRRLRGQNFQIDADDALTAAALAARARRAVVRSKVGLVVVDYLQLLVPENLKDNRTQQVGLMARRMKQMARACKVPVILLSQLNRAADNRGKPRLADLRESGEIEAHADAVLLLHPKPDQPDDQPVWSTDLIVAKNRNGPKGEVTLAYVRAVTRFEKADLGRGR